MNIIQELWNVAIRLLQATSQLWDWLNKPIKLNIDLGLFKVGIPDFTPLGVIGVGFTAIMLLWFIKSLLPVA